VLDGRNDTSRNWSEPVESEDKEQLLDEDSEESQSKLDKEGRTTTDPITPRTRDR